MGGVDIGSEGGRKRATNSDINMIPFIDLLMVTIAFLLITAVWVTNSRIEARADVPGPVPTGPIDPPPIERTLHVHVGENEFGLVWKQAGTVISESKVPRAPSGLGGSAEPVRYPELAAKIADEWKHEGTHTDPSDARVDQAVLHTDDKLAFKEIVGVLDAIAAARRDFKLADGSTRKAPALNATFSIR